MLSRNDMTVLMQQVDGMWTFKVGLSLCWQCFYNNFPWPQVTEAQRTKIEQTAQGILDARALYPDSNFADLYDDLTMPYELQKAHRANDAAILEAYGFPKDATESDIVARLFKMYQKLTNNN